MKIISPSVCQQNIELVTVILISSPNVKANKPETMMNQFTDTYTGIILCMHPVNEIWRYSVTPSLIRWVHTQNDPCIYALLSLNAMPQPFY